jgi:hypothetical protein
MPPKKTAQEKMRQTARIMVDMEHGVYAWPDGTSPVMKNGKPRISKTVALLEAGYKESYVKEAYTSVFTHPYYLEQYHFFLNERDVSVVRALEMAQTNNKTLSRVAEGLLNLALKRIEEDPESVSTANAIRYAKDYVRLVAEIEGKLNVPGAKNLTGILMVGAERLGPEQRGRITEIRDKYRSDRDRELESLARAADAMDEGDIIDADYTEG